MKKLFLACVLLMPLSGCADGPVSPQQSAAKMIDAQVQDVKNAISNHEGRLPSDRLRWQQSDITILDNLYRRLDDLYRQRQLLAVELGKQTFDPTGPATPAEKPSR